MLSLAEQASSFKMGTKFKPTSYVDYTDIREPEYYFR